MEEKTIVKGELKRASVFWVSMILPILLTLGTLLYNYMVALDNQAYYYNREFSESLAYAFGFDNGANLALYPAVLISCIIGIVLYIRMSKVQITVTDKRVYGINVASKRVDLPFDSITAVGTSVFSGLAVSTASGSLKFTMLKNRDELHETISKLLVLRQDKVASTVIKPEIQHSNADELKKFKDLLDSGIITQEEFDAKKKQLLGL